MVPYGMVLDVSWCLDGLRGLELARWQAGPRAGMILSDLGAEVLKNRDAGWRFAPRNLAGLNEAYNRGKKSICLDLRQPEGLDHQS